MKVELTGISKQSPQPPTAQVGAPPAEPAGHVVMAQFSPVGADQFSPYGTGVFVPYEIVQGAQVGDIFTLHLERAK